jgi:superoxide dismutase, Fe-Mn family
MFTLPDLPYDYAALEPFIDTETMHLHHDKHHAAYIKNLNEALSGHDNLLSMDVNELLKNFDNVPEEVRQKVKNNAGGHANHSLFWEIMTPNSDFQILNSETDLAKSIMQTFGSLDKFKEEFSAKALAHFGSGWSWLVVTKTQDGSQKLEITETANQDNPISQGATPILCLDVWEHAYYLKYKNVRADYVNAWWNVVNWNRVEENYKKAGDK